MEGRIFSLTFTAKHARDELCLTDNPKEASTVKQSAAAKAFSSPVAKRQQLAPSPPLRVAAGETKANSEADFLARNEQQLEDLAVRLLTAVSRGQPLWSPPTPPPTILHLRRATQTRPNLPAYTTRAAAPPAILHQSPVSPKKPLCFQPQQAPFVLRPPKSAAELFRQPTQVDQPSHPKRVAAIRTYGPFNCPQKPSPPESLQ